MRTKIFAYGRVSSSQQNEERQINYFKDMNINDRDIYIDILNYGKKNIY